MKRCPFCSAPIDESNPSYYEIVSQPLRTQVNGGRFVPTYVFQTLVLIVFTVLVKLGIADRESLYELSRITDYFLTSAPFITFFSALLFKMLKGN
jgi:hypothetical protein